ncbi:MAG: bi-domain-containing oxidoreductase [Bacteroidia bacterium]|nr:bi-domain-containing oxidoreductase [Bacteroidia bacterium]
MKQLIQNLKTGETSLIEVPIPYVNKGQVLIRTTRSLVSLGTEKMLVEFSKANLLNKARQQPDKVRQVLEKIKSDGLLPTLETVFKRLEEPLSLGYCNVGVVEEVGSGITDLKLGDRVASNGKHAEYVCVNRNLVAKIPDNVTDDQAAFTVISSIGLQGIRLCNPTFGETIVVFGLGLIGLLTSQMLKANGCNVIGIDIDDEKCKLANSWGVVTINPATGTDPVKSVIELTSQVGADGVIITASAKTDDIIAQSAKMSRKRGRIILVGVVGLNISRADFYEKELTFQVSSSYGPGRYDENYEQKGNDYPLPFVRWSENRNFQAILNSMSSGQINVNPLITERIEIDNYNDVYGNMGKRNTIASLFIYSAKENIKRTRNIRINQDNYEGSEGVIGIIGAGNFTKMSLLPALKKANAEIKYIASSNGLNGTILAKKFGISNSTTDYKEILLDSTIDAVMITTRHNSHAKIAIEALKAGKKVYVEKPLAINQDELTEVAANLDKGSIMIGFNRRFSPHTQAIKKSLGTTSGAINIIATMNAGFIPENVWVHDPELGGGRIIGEACHYIDLCVYLANSLVKSVCMNAMGHNPDQKTDNASILLKFENGSNAVVNYFANGSKSYSKERLEVYSQEKTYISDNFRLTKAYGVKNFKPIKTKINKGLYEEMNLFIQLLKKGGEPLISIDQIMNVSKASIACIQSLKESRWIDIIN